MLLLGVALDDWFMTNQEAMDLLEIAAPISRESLNTAYEQMATVWHPDSFAGMEKMQAKAVAKSERIYQAYLWLYHLPEDQFPYRVEHEREGSFQSMPSQPYEVPSASARGPKAAEVRRAKAAGCPAGMVDIAAPFMRRVGAFVIDMGLVLFAMMGVLFLKEFLAIQEMAVTGKNLPAAQEMTNGLRLLVSACVLLYYAVLECSGMQASLGKRMLGLVVTDRHGVRVSFGQGMVRAAGMLFSVLFFPLYFACLWTPSRQCLHDLLAGCQVMWRLPAESAHAVLEKEAASQLNLKQLGGLAAALLIAGLARMVKDAMKNPSKYPAPYVAPATKP